MPRRPWFDGGAARPHWGGSRPAATIFLIRTGPLTMIRFSPLALGALLLSSSQSSRRQATAHRYWDDRPLQAALSDRRRLADRQSRQSAHHCLEDARSAMRVSRRHARGDRGLPRDQRGCVIWGCRQVRQGLRGQAQARWRQRAWRRSHGALSRIHVRATMVERQLEVDRRRLGGMTARCRASDRWVTSRWRRMT